MSIKTTLLLTSLCAISLAFTSELRQPVRNGFAVLELFTSEGCSSCPPADALVAKIETENKDRSVYVLAYHVDYWDRLGWKDTFSERIFSQRQGQYAKWLRLGSVYTPQIVVNGSKEFVGSEEKTLRDAIAASLSEAGNTKLGISLSGHMGESLIMDYQINQPTSGYNLLVAFITPNARNKIERGENKGRTLSHVQIVRSLENFSLNGEENGRVSFLPAKGIQQGSADIIALLQNGKTGKITAVAKLKY
ncbi:DUF1223 domain-containing protein [Pedobacter hartonius]|uniref:DUF1223 domain-containing protein n=1 Tax=Pedobacter hartonius TaxID=425514 RepID=A0A1H4HH07_9SPHI|nr:DUF1223 domain-containing protein [Pedobacter hartonius]SEB20971.1 hypothetical protein SAMN05443550_11822 [Pedobacter hartonius]